MRTYKASFSAVFAQKRGRGKISLRRHPTSTGGALTGEGGDVIILDDPQDPLMANSEAERAATISFFTNTLQSRLNDARTGTFIIVMQRLHEQDLTGYILAHNGDFHPALTPEAVGEDCRKLMKDSPKEYIEDWDKRIAFLCRALEILGDARTE